MITNLVYIFKLYNSLFCDNLANFIFSLLRTKNKYRVFRGLWFGEDKPFFSTFFKPFVDTLKKTEVHGIDVVLPCGTKAKSKVVALSSHFDLPACAGSLEQVTCTGHDSCSFCYEHGEVIKTSARGVWIQGSKPLVRTT
ncbi:uncharacterized protein LOC141860531 isoform X2 [Acropora palmata]|uniref:uncharacterized protein LOC141860531 isoform X2 n=1 Tax=Acropora palmata TaxID=6131 RepID=UPI003DA1236D